MASRLAAPTRRGVQIKAVRPNAGIEAAYRKRLEALIAEMTASVNYWLRVTYRKELPRIAQAHTPVENLNRAFRALSKRWQRRFDDLAPKMAEHFAKSATERSDSAFRAALKRGGFAVNFKLTPAANDALRAVITENVSLIRSIASEYLTDVEGLVMRSASVGRDLSTLTQELQHRHGITYRRAAFIARDQNNKATAVIQKVRQTELGITQAKWLHSAGGKQPRPEHVAFSGKTYDVAKGAFLEGKWVWPGTEPNCRCVSISIIPGLD